MIDISDKSITYWYRWFRICMRLFLNDIGQNDDDKFTGCVEIDESSFKKKSKYGRGNRYKNNWVFGIISRESGKQKYFVVPDRTRETLIAIIMREVAEGTEIMSDGFRSYTCLSSFGFQHHVVNHSEEFVNAFNRRIHTQKIEGAWRWVKKFTMEDGPNKLAFLQERLDEWTFRCTYMRNPQYNMQVLARLVGKYGVAAHTFLKTESGASCPYYRS